MILNEFKENIVQVFLVRCIYFTYIVIFRSIVLSLYGFCVKDIDVITAISTVIL